MFVRALLLLSMTFSVAATAQTPPAPLAAASAPRAVEEFRFHHEHVLGTSLDLVVVADGARQAEHCEAAVLAEIRRLSKILSTYDPHSEISLLSPARGPVPCSPELIEVLEAYDTWHQRSGGALNARLGLLIETWKQAERADTLPDDATLAKIVEQVNQPAWRIDRGQRLVGRLNDLPLNVDALAKGYMVDKALAAARAKEPSLIGIMLDIGGDVAVWGIAAESHAGGADENGVVRRKRSWRIGVADPHHSEDNAPPLTMLRLDGGGVAASGSYARFHVVGGKRHSHVFDPRTGRPADGVAGAAVVAADCATADALATILCVLPPAAGLKLVESLPSTQCLVVAADGTQHASGGWAALAAPTSQTPIQESAGPQWPKGGEVNITLTIRKPDFVKKKYVRPYVAAWIEDAQGAPVRTLAVWGNETKYFKELPRWWTFARKDRDQVATVARASRGPGQYRLVWDGTDEAGKRLPPGKYTVRVEAAREHGSHVDMRGAVQCGAKAAAAKIQGNAEIDELLVAFVPAKSALPEAALAKTEPGAKRGPPPPNEPQEGKKPPDGLRIWTDATGKHTVEAAFRGMAGGVVSLKTRDGQILKMPLEKLSDEDQQWIRQRRKAAG